MEASRQTAASKAANVMEIILRTPAEKAPPFQPTMSNRFIRLLGESSLQKPTIKISASRRLPRCSHNKPIPSTVQSLYIVPRSQMIGETIIFTEEMKPIGVAHESRRLCRIPLTTTRRWTIHLEIMLLDLNPRYGRLCMTKEHWYRKAHRPRFVNRHLLT